MMDKIKSIDRNEFLGSLGLQLKPTWSDYLVPALAVFGAGVVIGASVGLLYAPRSGRETRDDLSRRLQNVPQTLAELPQKAMQATQKAVQSTSSSYNPSHSP